MSLRGKLFLGLVPGLLMIFVLGITGYWVLDQVAVHAEGLERLFADHDRVQDLQLVLHEVTEPVAAYLITGDPAERERFAVRAKDVEARFETVHNAWADDERATLVLEDALAEWQRVRSLAEQILALPDPVGNPQGAVLLAQMNSRAHELIQTLDALHDWSKERGLAMAAEAHRARNTLGVALLLGTVLALVGGLGFGWYFSQHLSRPLVALMRAAEAMAQGDLSRRVALSGKDEIARVAHAFNIMAETLQRQQEELRASLKRRVAEVTALNAIAAATVEAGDLTSILDTALEQVLSVVDMEAAGVYLPSPASAQRLELVAHRGLPKEFAAAVSRLSADTGFTGQAYRQGQTIVLEDIAGQAPDRTLPAVVQYGWRAFAAVPITCDGHVVGVLVVGSRERGKPAAQDMAFLKIAANQLGAAVENARLRQQSERRLRELATLADLAEKVNYTLVADEAIEMVVDVLCRQLDIPAAWFVSATEDAVKPFECTLTFNLPPALREAGAMEGMCYCQRMALRGDLTAAVNVLECERLKGRSPQETRGLTRHATVPVQSEGRLFGLLNLALPEGRVLDADELHLVTAAGRTLAVALERARLHEQVKAARVKEQQTLLKLSQTLLGKTEMQDVLDVTVQVAAEALDVEFAAVALIDEDGQHYSGRAAVGWPAEVLRQAQHIPLDSNMGLAYAIRTRAPVVIPNEEEETRFNTPPWVRAVGIVSSLLVPMIVGEAPIGGLVVNSRTHRAWTEDEVRLLSLIANQAAQALERARLFQEARQRAEDLSRLYDLSLELAEATDPREVCRRVTRAAARALEAQGCLLAEFDREARRVRGLAPAYGLPDEVALSVTYEVTEEVVQVWNITQQPYVIVPDVNRLFPPLRELAARVGVRSLLAARMMVAEEPVGILFVADRKDGKAFGEEDARLLAAYGQQAALALARARAHEAAQRRLEELEAYQRVTKAALETFTLEERLRVVLQETMSLLGAEVGAIYLKDEDYLTAAAKQGLPDDLWSRLERIALSGAGGCQDALRVWNAHSEATGLRTLETLSLEAEGKEIGVMVLASPRASAFAPEQLQTLRALAEQAAVVIEHARLHEELGRAYQEVQEALQLREDMIRNVSHELRTPLTSLRGYLELFIDGFLGDLTPEQEKALRVMHRNAERLRFMVERLLTLQTLDVKVAKKEHIPTGEWLAEVGMRWQPKFAEHNVTILVDAPPDLPPLVGDKDLLDQVMDNLVHNALKFSPEGSTVQIEARATDKEILIAVRDEGIGIPQEKLSRIFERFYQVDASPTRRFEGMGIGLALVKEIVQKHGGRVWAESEGEGKGSTFYVALPAKG